jgi:hypothetical protein
MNKNMIIYFYIHIFHPYLRFLWCAYMYKRIEDCIQPETDEEYRSQRISIHVTRAEQSMTKQLVIRKADRSFLAHSIHFKRLND